MICPVCGKPHPPIECLAKALTNHIHGLPVLLVPGPLLQVLQGGAPLLIPPPGFLRRRPRNRFRDLPEVEFSGKLLTAARVRKRWRKKKRAPHCKDCRAPATLDTFLDYAFCDPCNRALATRDVSWRRPRKGKKKRG